MREALWIELEVLTPTHIGNGTEISPIEYWIDERFARVQMDALFADSLFAPYLDEFISNAASERYLGRHLPSDLIRRHVRYQVPIAPDARQYLVEHQVVVKEYIKSAGRSFIPGSSIKGSLLSALINRVLGEECRSAQKKDPIEQNINSADGFSRLLDTAIGGLKSLSEGKGDRFYRWLDVSDSTLSQPEVSLNVYYSEVVGSKKGNLPILFEGLLPGTRWICSLAAGSGLRFNLTEVLKIVDGFYRAVWKKSGIREAAPENGYLLRLGQGSSAWATSLLLLAESAGLKYRLKPPRTRKLVDARTPMGWVMLTTINREDPAGWQMPKPSPFKVDVDQYTVETEEATPVATTPGRVTAQAVPQPPQRMRPPGPPEDVRASVSVKAMLGLVSKVIPSDKIGLERILEELDGLQKEQALEVAIALRERLSSLGRWEKHPKRFDIECFIRGD